MRRLLVFLISFVSLSAFAQEATDAAADSAAQAAPVVKFGYLSYDVALASMSEKAAVEQQMKELRSKYDAETKRVESEFNKKYEAFLEGQRDFPRTILLKRQNELQDLLQKNIAFKADVRKELRKAEAEAMAPLKERLNKVLAVLAAERGYALIINTDSNACPYIDPRMGEDINAVVLERLQQTESEEQPQ